MNRKGLELLIQETGDSDYLNELLNNEILTADFKTFIKNYKVGQQWTLRNLLLVDEKTDDKIGLTKITMFEPNNNQQQYHACLDYIFSHSRLIEEIEKYQNKTENWNDLGFVQIGLMHWSDVLLIGVEPSNKGEIWRYGTGIIDNSCSKLDNNIFKFISRLTESIDNDYLKDYNIEPSTVFKNLTESFWRVRKNKN